MELLGRLFGVPGQKARMGRIVAALIVGAALLVLLVLNRPSLELMRRDPSPEGTWSWQIFVEGRSVDDESAEPARIDPTQLDPNLPRYGDDARVR